MAGKSKAFKMVIVLGLTMSQVACVGAFDSAVSSSSSISFSGKAQLGPVNGATVSLYCITATGAKGATPFASAVTDADGEFLINVSPKPSCGVVAELSGGSYSEESTGASKSLSSDQKLRTILGTVSLASQGEFSITPVTEMAYRRFDNLKDGYSQSMTSADIATLSNRANEEVRLAVGLPEGAEVHRIIPASPSSPNADSNSNENKLALFLAGLSQLADDNGLDSMEATEYFANDFGDGVMDDENWELIDDKAATWVSGGQNTGGFTIPPGGIFVPNPAPIVSNPDYNLPGNFSLVGVNVPDPIGDASSSGLLDLKMLSVKLINNEISFSLKWEANSGVLPDFGVYLQNEAGVTVMMALADDSAVMLYSSSLGNGVFDNPVITIAPAFNSSERNYEFKIDKVSAQALLGSSFFVWAEDYTSLDRVPDVNRIVFDLAPSAKLNISDGPTFDFGSVTVGSSSDHTLTIANFGQSGALSVSGGGLAAPFSFKGGVFPGTGGTCGATLNNGAACSIVVSYSPSSAVISSDQIVLNFFNGIAAKSITRDLSGTGVAAPTFATLAISDGPSYNFGSITVGSSQDKSFVISNSGTGTATAIAASGLAAPFAIKGGTFPGTGGTCSNTLAAGASCTFVLSFSPTVATSSADSIVIDYNDGSSAQSSSRDLSGTGVSAGSATLAMNGGPLLDFGSVSVGGSLDLPILVTNSGAISAISISGGGLAAPFSFKGGSYPGTGGNCGTTLGALGNPPCTIYVTFSPTSAGAFADTLDLSYFDGSTMVSVSRDLSGTGAAAASLVISDGVTYDYGSITSGTTSDHAFVITNVGSTSATSMMGAAIGSGFGYKGGSYPGTGGTCGTVLAASSNCTVMVTFSPSSAGAYSSTLTINFNDGSGVQAATRSIVGTGL